MSAFARLADEVAYYDTTGEQCGLWLHAADLARQLAKTMQEIEKSRTDGSP